MPTDKPKSASLAELKQEFPQSSAEWRESQLEAGASLDQAKASWTDHRFAELEGQLAERDETIASLTEKNEAQEGQITELKSEIESLKEKLAAVELGEKDPVDSNPQAGDEEKPKTFASKIRIAGKAK